MTKTKFIILSIIIGFVLAHGSGHSHIDESNTYFKQIKAYIQNNVHEKTGQVALSIFIISFPSIPVFLSLSFLGKLLKGKGDKHNFSERFLNYLLAFACGTLLGDVLLHMLPYLFGAHSHGHEAHQHSESGCTHDHSHDHDHAHDHADEHFHLHQETDHAHDHQQHSDHVHISSEVIEPILSKEHIMHNFEEMIVPLMIIGGILLFFVLDYIFMKIHKSNEGSSKKKAVEKGENSSSKSNKVEQSHHHHHKSEEEEEEHSAIPFLIADFLHNFTDGIAIGAAYTVSFQMGITSTFVIMIHELPHEIGDFAHLIKYGYNLSNILATQFLTSLGALLGGFIGLYTGEIYKKELLSITAGGFLYTCLVSVIPELKEALHKDHSLFNLIAILFSTLLGIAFMFYVTLIE